MIHSLAILALLFNALAPSVSQAMVARAQAGNSAWIELCSSTGMRWVRLDGDGQVAETRSQRPADAPAGLSSAACGYCLTHAASFALPPLDLSLALPSLSVRFAAPVAIFAALHPAPLWARPEARAPPQLIA